MEIAKENTWSKFKKTIKNIIWAGAPANFCILNQKIWLLLSSTSLSKYIYWYTDIIKYYNSFSSHCSAFDVAFAGLNVMLCAIWYHLYNLKNVKNTQGGVLLLVACNFSKSNTPPWVFFTFFKLLKMVPNCAKRLKYIFPAQAQHCNDFFTWNQLRSLHFLLNFPHIFRKGNDDL